jgi:hypothetical protein
LACKFFFLPCCTPSSCSIFFMTPFPNHVGSLLGYCLCSDQIS